MGGTAPGGILCTNALAAAALWRAYLNGQLTPRGFAAKIGRRVLNGHLEIVVSSNTYSTGRSVETGNRGSRDAGSSYLKQTSPQEIQRGL